MIEVQGWGQDSELFECWAPLGPHTRNGCATQKGNRAKPQRSGSRTLRPAALFLATTRPVTSPTPPKLDAALPP